MEWYWLSALVFGFAPMAVRFLVLPLFDKKVVESEPQIPTAGEDWDAEFERRTGQRVPFTSRRIIRGSIRGSFTTLFAPGLRTGFNDIQLGVAQKVEIPEEVFDEPNDETLSIFPNVPEPQHGPDAEY